MGQSILLWPWTSCFPSFSMMRSISGGSSHFAYLWRKNHPKQMYSRVRIDLDYLSLLLMFRQLISRTTRNSQIHQHLKNKMIMPILRRSLLSSKISSLISKIFVKIQINLNTTKKSYLRLSSLSIYSMSRSKQTSLRSLLNCTTTSSTLNLKNILFN